MTTQHLFPAERQRLEQTGGIIFDIQRYSVHDGPGLRTNVFFKGCPLRCGWCSNPESQQRQPEIAVFENNCMACGQFDPACPDCRPNGNDTTVSLAKFDERVTMCPMGAVRRLGEQRTAGAVIEEVLRDRPFYQGGGGMTLTGGEVTMQPDMAEALLWLARAEGISTALETCGHIRWAVFERLLPHTDHILFDVKHVDSAVHRRHTGLGNELILANLERLVEVDAPVTIRVPLIPGFNTTVEAAQAIAAYVNRLNISPQAVDVLPYHTFGTSKYKALGRDYPWQEHQRLTDEEVDLLVNVFKQQGPAVTTGGL